MRFFLTLVLCAATLSVFSTETESFCLFTPPQGWELSDPRNPALQVQIAFLKNTGKGFCPSINLAVEKTNVSMTEYLKAVKAIHEQDRNQRFRLLGKVRTKAGLGQLIEIDAPSEWGPVRILQLLFVKEGHAYILTAAALKEEFANYYKEIQEAFRSLTLTPDLLSTIPQLERRESLKNKQHELLEVWQQTVQKESQRDKQWQKFQQTILDDFQDMGAFWQILVLKNTQEQLPKLISQNTEN